MRNRQERSDAEEAALNKGGGKLSQWKGKVKETWGDLTDNPSIAREGKRERIKGNLQEEYGETKQKESRLEKDLEDIESGV